MGGYFVNAPDSYGNSTFLARRVRPILEGTLSDHFDFRIMPDFGNGSTTLVDAYADFKVFPELNFRIGKFKPPVGLERLRNINHIGFVELAAPSSLVPNRDLGIQVSGAISKGLINYALGVFNGVADAASADADLNDGKEIAGRIFVQPFINTEIEPLKGLGLGVAGTYGKTQGTTSSPSVPTYKTAGQYTAFRYTNSATNVTIADGKQYRIVPQLYYSWGPFGLLGEYVRSTQKVDNNAASQTFTHQAWQAAASYVLTGEKASFGGFKPKKPFNLKKGGTGAVELAARYHELKIDDDVFPTYANRLTSVSQARSFGGGINWYLNDNVKLVTDFDYTKFDDGATLGDRDGEYLVGSRVQLAF